MSVATVLSMPAMQPFLAACDFGTEGMLVTAAGLATLSSLEALRRGASHWQLALCACARKSTKIWTLTAVAVAWVAYVLPSYAPMGPGWRHWDLRAATCEDWGLPGVAGLANLMPVFGRSNHQCLPYSGGYAGVELQLVALGVPLILILPAMGGRRISMLVLVLLLISATVVAGAIVSTHSLRWGPTVAWGEGPAGDGRDGSGTSSSYARLFAWAPWARMPSMLISLAAVTLWDVGVDGRWAWRIQRTRSVEVSRMAQGMSSLVVGDSAAGEDDDNGAPFSPMYSESEVSARVPQTRGGADAALPGRRWTGGGGGVDDRYDGYESLRG